MLKNKFTNYVILYLITITTILLHTQTYNAKNRKHEIIFQQGLSMQDYSFCNPVTLNEISKIAKTNRQDLEGYSYLIESYWHAEHAALGAFLPQITLSADTGKSSREDISGISQLPRESITFDASQLIFSLGGPKLKYKMAQEDTEISIAQKNKLKNSIQLRSETAFLDLQKEMLRKELINNLNASSTITFDQSKVREVAGFLNKAQFANAESEFIKDQIDVENFPGNITILTKQLERETNTHVEPSLVSLDLENIEKVKLLSEQEYYKIAMANRPDLQEKTHQIKQANLSNKYYKYKYVPEIYLTGHVQKARMMQCPPAALSAINFDNTPLIWHVGLNATWNFDGFSSLNTSKQFDDLSTNYLLKKRDLELEILKDIQSLRGEIELQINLLEPARKKLNAAKIELDNIKTQYEVGLIALYKYKQTQLAYTKSEYDLTALKINLRYNYQKLLFLCGYPEDIDN